MKLDFKQTKTFLKNKKKIFGNFIFLTSTFFVGYELSKISKKPEVKMNRPNSIQYLNRLFEWFDEDSIDQAIADYVSFINMQLEPADAFDLVVSEVSS